MIKIIIVCFLLGCADVHDNNIEVTANIDMCEMIDSIQSKEEEKEDNPSPLKQEWEECEFNEDCETELCMCFTCIDIAKFIKFE